MTRSRTFARTAWPSLLDPVIEPERHTVEDGAVAFPAEQDKCRTTDGEMTLDQLLVRAWQDVFAHRTALCPACGGSLVPRHGSGSGPVGGQCADCRTTLS